MIGICTMPAFASAPVDITLADSIQMALKNNHAIKESLYDVESAQWKLVETSHNKGPTVSWPSTTEKLGSGVYENATYNHEFANAINASMPFYTSGKLEN